MKKYYVNYDEAKCELEKHGCYEISIERFEIEEEEEEEE